MKLICFDNGAYSYAVNPDKIAFVGMAKDGQVRIFFSADEDDCIPVNQEFAEVFKQLTSNP